MPKDSYEDENFRLEIARDASVHWYGEGKYTHLPTGMVEKFKVAWNDRSQQKVAWEQLKARVVHATNEQIAAETEK